MKNKKTITEIKRMKRLANIKENLENDDLMYDRMLTIDQEQLVSQILSFAETNPTVTLVDYLNSEWGYGGE